MSFSAAMGVAKLVSPPVPSLELGRNPCSYLRPRGRSLYASCPGRVRTIADATPSPSQRTSRKRGTQSQPPDISCVFSSPERKEEAASDFHSYVSREMREEGSSENVASFSGRTLEDLQNSSNIEPLGAVLDDGGIGGGQGGDGADGKKKKTGDSGDENFGDEVGKKGTKKKKGGVTWLHVLLAHVGLAGAGVAFGNSRATAQAYKTVDTLQISSEMAECAGCHRRALADTLWACSGCYSQFYCGRNCQRNDWANHRITCNVTSTSGAS